MAMARAEPFQVALASLRDRLREGAFPPGARITAVDVADDLRLSATPVREALSRLAGEGLIEDRRGQGYFVRLLTATDIADLHRLSLAHLLIAQDPHRARAAPACPVREGAQASAPDPVRAVERLFLGWAAEASSRTLVHGLRLVQAQLGAVRRREHLLFTDLEAEAARLLAGAGGSARSERMAAARQFHGRRIRSAGLLAALQAGADLHENSPDID